MSHPSDQRGPDQIPAELERELASLTAPPASHRPGVLADQAWEIAHAQTEPKVFQLRLWLAPMAVAATLVLVGLAVTSLRFPSRSVPDVAIAPETALLPPSAPASGDGAAPKLLKSESAAEPLDRLNDGLEKRDAELAMRREPSTSNIATLEQRTISGGTTGSGGVLGKVAESEKGVSKEADQKLKQAGEGAKPAASARGRDDAKSDAASRKSSDPDAIRENAPRADATPASVPPAPVSPAPTSAESKPAAPGEVPVPGGSTSQSRAQSQFAGREWHADDRKAGAAGARQDAAPGFDRSASGPESKDASAPASPDGSATPVPTAGFAYRVFVLGKWWWVGIATLIAGIFVYWRRRLARLDREPAPDQ